MPVSVTPVLSSSSGYVTDVRDQVMSLVRFTIMNPGFISSLWEDNLVSFRKLSSTYDSDRDTFVAKINDAIASILRNKFTDYTFSCNFQVESVDEKQDDGRYTLKFDITITGGPSITQEIPAIVAGRVNVDNITNDISLIWERSEDTASLLGG